MMHLIMPKKRATLKSSPLYNLTSKTKMKRMGFSFFTSLSTSIRSNWEFRVMEEGFSSSSKSLKDFKIGSFLCMSNGRGRKDSLLISLSSSSLLYSNYMSIIAIWARRFFDRNPLQSQNFQNPKLANVNNLSRTSEKNETWHLQGDFLGFFSLPDESYRLIKNEFWFVGKGGEIRGREKLYVREKLVNPSTIQLAEHKFRLTDYTNSWT